MRDKFSVNLNNPNAGNADRKSWQDFLQPLFEALIRSSSQRSGFKVDALVDASLDRYSKLEWGTLFHPAHTTESATYRYSIKITTVPSADLDAFFVRLMGSSESGRDQAIAQVGPPKRLAPLHTPRLLKEFHKNYLPNAAKANSQSLDTALYESAIGQWLQKVTNILLPEVILDIMKASGLTHAANLQALRDELKPKIRNEEPYLDAYARLWAGDILGAIGDDRPGVGLDGSGLPDIDWVEIEAHEFYFDDEKSSRKGEAFSISRYPITNAQYDAFIEDGGYDTDAWWEGMEKPHYEDSHWLHPNRPKTDVTWYEATAFCRWLSNKSGKTVVLPTETQWVQAARGSVRREYPWGDIYEAGRANVKEVAGKIGKGTSSVGLYSPAGDTPETNIADLSGNVWEWCRNKYDNPHNIDPDESRDSRVLRGGSWILDPGLARVSVRRGYDPDYRFNFIGFRVCLLPS